MSQHIKDLWEKGKQKLEFFYAVKVENCRIIIARNCTSTVVYLAVSIERYY